MRIIIITQDEPFFLSEKISYLLNNMPKGNRVVGCVLTSPSPFGKRESFFQKAHRTLKIFGVNFFIYYAIKFLYVKLFNKSVKDIINENGIPLIEIESNINTPTSLSEIAKFKPDLLISILGNQVFKHPLINLAPKGCINLHTALLPKYRGLMPTFWVLRNNEKYTGVSVFYVDEGIDSGPIIIQKKIKIGMKTQQELINETKQIGMDLIHESINLIDRNQVKIIDNLNSEKSYYSFPTRQDVKIFKQIGKKFF